MVILGLGANLFDRLKQLRHAFQLLKNIPELEIKQVSPLYISDALTPENAPEKWNIPYLNLAIRCETTLKPMELLKRSKQIEKIVGRTPEKEWGPRVIDIDILAWDDLVRFDETLHIPHEHLHERPFALFPLSDVASRWVYPLPGPFEGKTATEMAARFGSKFDGTAPFHTKQISMRIDTPALMGILNVTPDSVSGDGIFSDVPKALEAAKQFVENGAEIIDIGAEATGPKATPIDATTEWERLEPVLKSLLQEREHFLIVPKISVDTRHAAVAEKALALGVDWINEVSGLADPAMIALLKNQSCDIVFMHHLGIPVSKQQGTLPLTENPVPLVYAFAKEKISFLESQGISRDRLIFDVGIGFGKNGEQSLELIKHIADFKSLGVRLLVGHSRKVFLTQFISKPYPERDIETNVVSLFLADQPVDYLRVHHVEQCARAFKVKRALQ